MHCPSCGQQQVSNETKFCSRCGMPLSVVAEVVSYGGYLPQLADLEQKKLGWLNRRNGMGVSLIWWIFFILLAILGGGVAGNEDFGGAMAAIAFFGSAIIFFSSLIFLKKPFVSYALPVQQTAPPQLYGQPQQHALPAQQSIPINAYGAPETGNWRDTNDLQPTSVTESTTRLLNDEERR